MSILFESVFLKGLRIKNRIVRSATMENMATPEGMPTEDTRCLYEQLAWGGIGLIITGLAYVNRVGQGYPLLNGAHSDAIIQKWREITDVVHSLGGKIAMQIVHCGAKTDSMVPKGRRLLSPSEVINLTDFSLLEAMTEREIWETINDFGAAAARVKKAGFDAVQIHGAHGYLVSSFLSPFSNHRRDDFGGSPSRRLRFLVEIIRSVRQAVSADFPVLCKVNVDDFIWIGRPSRNGLPPGQSLVDAGLDALEISGGTHLPALNNLPYAKRIKPRLNIPLILVGGIRKRETAERILKTGCADLISICRPLVREPDLPNKWLEGSRKTAQCQSCLRCNIEVERGHKLMCYRKLVKNNIYG